MTIRTTFDQNSEQKGIEPIPPFIANQLSHEIDVSDIVCGYIIGCPYIKL